MRTLPGLNPVMRLQLACIWPTCRVPLAFDCWPGLATRAAAGSARVRLFVGIYTLSQFVAGTNLTWAQEIVADRPGVSPASQAEATDTSTGVASADLKSPVALAAKSMVCIAILGPHAAEHWESPGVDEPNGAVQGLACGICISGNGHILTTFQAVEGGVQSGARLMVCGSNRVFSRAQVLATDPRRDLAVLRSEGPVAEPAVWGNGQELPAGAACVVLGGPLQLLGQGAPVVDPCHITLVERLSQVPAALPFELELQIPLSDSLAAYGEVWHHDGKVPLGSGGGALVDTSGRLVGVLPAAPGRGQFAETVYPLTPATIAAIQGLMAGGEVTYGMLGVVASQQQPTHPDGPQGVLVSDVEEGSPAAQSGILPGEVITHLDHQPVATFAMMQHAVAEVGWPGKVTLAIYRQATGKSRSVDVKLAKLGHRVRPIALPRHEPWRGLTLDEASTLPPRPARNRSFQGAAVVGVQPDSPAALAGVLLGTVVVEVDGEVVTSSEELLQRVAQAEGEVRLAFSDGSEVTVSPPR